MTLIYHLPLQNIIPIPNKFIEALPNKFIEALATIALNEFDAVTRVRLRAARGSVQRQT
jgi:hypothetical protein